MVLKPMPFFKTKALKGMLSGEVFLRNRDSLFLSKHLLRRQETLRVFLCKLKLEFGNNHIADSFRNGF